MLNWYSDLLPSRRTHLKLAQQIMSAQRAIVQYDCVSYQQRPRLPNRAGGVASCTVVAHDEWAGGGAGGCLGTSYLGSIPPQASAFHLCNKPPICTYLRNLLSFLHGAGYIAGGRTTSAIAFAT